MKAIIIRFLLISLSLFMLGIMYTGCERTTIKKVITVSGKVDDKGIHVWSNAKDNGDGSSWENAYNDLQKAIEAAKAAKNKVYVAQGTYKPTSYPNGGISDREKHFSLRNGVEVIGGYSGEGNENAPSIYRTILNGDIGKEDNISDNVYHVFYHPKGTNLDKTAKLKNVIITKGYAVGYGADKNGGGMYNSRSSPTLTNCKFTFNTASEHGGGMYNFQSSPRLTDCNFIRNEAFDYGGGMYNFQSSPTLTNCKFNSNDAQDGGGMNNYNNSSPTLTNCKFNSNDAQDGGGMRNYMSLPTLNNCTFTGNEASIHGGGMTNYMSSPRLTDCQFIENKASGNRWGMFNYYGGGMYNSKSSPTLNNCTFTGNTADDKGGAVYSNKDSYPIFNDETTDSFTPISSNNFDGRNNGNFKEN